MKQAIARKPQRPSGDARKALRQAKILGAACKMFAKRGYANTDTQLLADRLGVGKGTLYRYFPSKEALFLAAADHVMVQMREQVEASIANIGDPLDRIAAAIRAYLAFFANHPEFVELLIQERAQFKDRKKPTYFEHRESNVERWRDLYRNLIAEGRVREMPVERITDVMSDLVYGTMFTNFFTKRSKPFEAQAQEILDVVFNGILTAEERQRRRDKDRESEVRSYSAEVEAQ